MGERSVTLSEAIRRNINGTLDELHTWLPGVVTKYDAATQMVNVKPLIKHAYLNEEGDRQTESLAVVTNVPVRFMAGGGFALTCPISDGSLVDDDGATVPATTGCLFFSEASLDRWLAGSSGAEVDPEIDHRFQMTDAVFMPGLNPFGAPLPNVSALHALFGHVTGVRLQAQKNVMIVAKPGEEAGAGFVALGNPVDVVLSALTAAIAAYTTAGGGVAGSTAAWASLVTQAGHPSWPLTTKATEFKVK